MDWTGLCRPSRRGGPDPHPGSAGASLGPGERHSPDAGAKRRVAGRGLARRGERACGPGLFRGPQRSSVAGGGADGQTAATVVEWGEPHRFAWAVGDPDHPSTTWRFTVRPDGAGTVLEQSVRVGPGRSGLHRAIDAMPAKEQKIAFVRLRDFEAAMTRNLAAIKELAERTP